ncbi:carbohydrate kinase [Oceanococcus atlanticus]|uniref:Bifunctional NAD(P)H-hydrate repair enzyme n=2 Tax=Oceanococcus atlanticus TaxID=1317117 RepID=A0A1Y1SGS9_9GAMM|nr:carbohydrate kinase [Oceanococcus atlanticus]
MDMGLPLYSAQQVRNLDASAIRDCAIDGYELMQRAAASAWLRLRQHWPQVRTLGVLVGPGNNGGDALELARLAAGAGCAVRVWLLADPARFRAEAQSAWLSFSDADIGLQTGPLDEGLADCDVIVDGLLGTGLSRTVGAAFAEAISCINASDKPVLALDVPSGIHADSGAVMGLAVRADVTESFIGRKQGLYTGDAKDYAGQIYFSALDVPPHVTAQEKPSACLMPAHAPLAWMPPRQRNSHKGHHGHVLAVGGAPGYSGAIRLCAGAALRSGAGLVSVLTHPQCRVEVAGYQPELMVRAAEDKDLQAFDVLAERATVVAIGPGLDTQVWGRTWLERACAFDGVVVLDADALNLMDLTQRWPSRCVITPHPGEAARLLGISSAQVQADRFSAARQLAEASGAVTVLKGAGTLIAGPQGEMLVCEQGNPGMACGGMGDVLTGALAGLLAQAPDQPLLQTVGAAVVAHARAGDRVARRIGMRGMLPSDVLATLPEVLNP